MTVQQKVLKSYFDAFLFKTLMNVRWGHILVPTALHASTQLAPTAVIVQGQVTKDRTVLQVKYLFVRDKCYALRYWKYVSNFCGAIIDKIYEYG